MGGLTYVGLFLSGIHTGRNTKPIRWATEPNPVFLKIYQNESTNWSRGDTYHWRKRTTAPTCPEVDVSAVLNGGTNTNRLDSHMNGYRRVTAAIEQNAGDQYRKLPPVTAWSTPLVTRDKTRRCRDTRCPYSKIKLTKLSLKNLLDKFRSPSFL